MIRILVSFILFFNVLSFTQEKIKETVEVTNVVVPVRVYYKGELVSGLKKQDFKIYENGKLREINVFEEIRKKIGISEIGLHANHVEEYKPRFFVLVFRLTDYNYYFKRGIDYIFKNILREQDRLMVLANNSFFEEKRIGDLEIMKTRIELLLKRESMLAKGLLEKYLRHIKLKVKMMDFRRPGANFRDFLVIFLNNYLAFLNEYKKKFLLPDIDSFYYFSKYLEKINMEKWVINFYQIEQYPALKNLNEIVLAFAFTIDSQAKIINKLIMQIEKELKMSDNFPSEQVAKMFYKVNTSFHTILIRNLRVFVDKDLELKDISTDIENCLRSITNSTGGELIASNDLSKALEKISEIEDVHYLLSYVPGKIKKKRKIKVVVSDNKYKVKFDPNQFSDYINKYLKRKEKENPEIKIENVDTDNNTLFFIIKSFKRKKIKSQLAGRIKVIIKMVDENESIVFFKERELVAASPTMKINIQFRGIKAGDYYAFIDVIDLNNNKRSNYTKNIYIQ